MNDDLTIDDVKRLFNNISLRHAAVAYDSIVCHTCGGEGRVGHGALCSTCKGTMVTDFVLQTIHKLTAAGDT